MSVKSYKMSWPMWFVLIALLSAGLFANNIGSPIGPLIIVCLGVFAGFDAWRAQRTGIFTREEAPVRFWLIVILGNAVTVFFLWRFVVMMGWTS